MWQAEADTELTLSASPTTAVGQKALALAKRRYCICSNHIDETLWTSVSSTKHKHAMQAISLALSWVLA